MTASDDFDDSERVARADRPHEGGLVPRLEHVRNLRHVEKRRHARQQPLAEGGAASPCGNSAATARIRGWPRTTGQHAIVGRWLRRGRCSLVGTDRPQLEVAGHLVRPHGARACKLESIWADFGEVLILFSILAFSIFFGRGYNFRRNIGVTHIEAFVEWFECEDSAT